MELRVDANVLEEHTASTFIWDIIYSSYWLIHNFVAHGASIQIVPISQFSCYIQNPYPIFVV
jgi:hypothetical protein